VQVARLAGMPASLLRQARATLEALETSKHAADAQIDLFAAAPTPPQAEPSQLEAALAALDPDMLSPKEALAALYQLKLLQQGTPS
jgi:DNA mismatch repair protein MutS